AGGTPEGAGEVGDDGALLPRCVADAGGGVRREAGSGRRDVEQGDTELDGGAARPQVEDRQLLLRVDAEHHDAAGAVQVGDRRVRQAERDVGGQAVAELRVDVVGAQHALGEAGPDVGVLVG